MSSPRSEPLMSCSGWPAAKEALERIYARFGPRELCVQNLRYAVTSHYEGGSIRSKSPSAPPLPMVHLVERLATAFEGARSFVVRRMPDQHDPNRGDIVRDAEHVP